MATSFGQTIISVGEKSVERQARSSVLRQAGYRVLEASSEAEAFCLVDQERPALVILNTDSDERFRILADSAPVLMWMNGPDGCEFVNRAYLDFLGVNDVDVRGFDWAHYVHPDDRKGYVTAYLEAVVDRRLFEATFRFRRHDGEYRWMKSVGMPRFSADGTFLGYIGSTIDVTDLYQSELKEEGDLRYQSTAALQEPAEPPRRLVREYGMALGTTLVALLVRFVLDPFLGDHLPYVTFFVAVAITTWYGGWGASLTAVVLGGLLSNWFFMPPRYSLYLVEVHHQVGYAMYFLVSFTFVGFGQALRRSRQQAEAAMMQLRQEIDDRQGAEAALRESEARLRLAHQAAGVGAFDWNVQTGINTWTAELEVIYGLAPGEFGKTQGDWEALLHPDDRAMAVRGVEEAFETGATTMREFRIVRPDGTVRWIAGRWQVFKDESGEPLRLTGVNLDITERKQAEAALRQSEERWQLAVTGTTDGIWDWDIVRHTVFLSLRWKELRGYQEDEIGLDEAEWSSRIHPEDFSRVMTTVQAYLNKELSTFDCEYRTRCKDERYLWIVDRGVAIWDQQGRAIRMIGSETDITERKEAEKQLRENEERLRVLTTAMPQLVWVCSSAGECVYQSPQWDTVTGQSAEDSLKDGWAEMIHPEDRARTADEWRAVVAKGTSYQTEYRLHMRDGTYRWYLARAEALRDPSGTIVQWIGTSTDINDAKQTEGALRDAQERLQRWNVELEQAVNLKTAELQQSQERLRAMASELNLAEQRERKRLATELHDHLQQMLVFGKLMIGQSKRHVADIPVAAEALKNVDTVLSDALTYSRTLVAELSPPVLREHGMAAGLKWLAEHMEQKHGQRVTVIVPEDDGLTLPEDQRILLFQSVRELLINATKHAEIGAATVRMTETEDEVQIQVRDDGRGFDLAAAGGTPGGGISSKFGLFSIQERMRALGGSFEIQSKLGQGTTATLVMPVKKQPEGSMPSAEPLPMDAAALAPHQSVGSRIRVLLVDDHIMVRQGLRAVLDAYPDIELVGEGGDGEEAVHLVDELRPAVVMDISMPKMNGIDATMQIKRRYPETIIIGLSVNADDENLNAMKRAGAATLLTKEAAVDQLYQVIVSSVKAEQANRLPK